MVQEKNLTYASRGAWACTRTAAQSAVCSNTADAEVPPHHRLHMCTQWQRFSLPHAALLLPGCSPFPTIPPPLYLATALHSHPPSPRVCPCISLKKRPLREPSKDPFKETTTPLTTAAHCSATARFPSFSNTSFYTPPPSPTQATTLDTSNTHTHPSPATNRHSPLLHTVLPLHGFPPSPSHPSHHPHTTASPAGCMSAHTSTGHTHRLLLLALSLLALRLGSANS